MCSAIEASPCLNDKGHVWHIGSNNYLKNVHEHIMLVEHVSELFHQVLIKIGAPPKGRSVSRYLIAIMHIYLHELRGRTLGR